MMEEDLPCDVIEFKHLTNPTGRGTNGNLLIRDNKVGGKFKSNSVKMKSPTNFNYFKMIRHLGPRSKVKPAHRF